MSAQNDIFIGNIHQRTTEDELREIFSVCGSINSVRILVDKETGRAKGYAFVEYTNIDRRKCCNQTYLQGQNCMDVL